jgi:hypothetical protein
MSQNPVAELAVQGAKMAPQRELARFIDGSPRMLAQRRQVQLLQNSAARRMAPTAPRGTVIQRMPLDTEVRGLTHLVASRGGSLYDGDEVMETGDGARLQIDSADRILSRRGPNQETHGEADRLGKQIYTWVRVLLVDGKAPPGKVYVREDTITHALPLPSTLDVGARRERRGAIDDDGQPEQSQQPVSIWFTKKNVLDACHAIAKEAPRLTEKQLKGYFNKLLEQGALKKGENETYCGVGGFHAELRKVLDGPDTTNRKVAQGILAVTLESVNEALASRVDPASLHRDWFHDFAGTLAMLVDRKDLSESAISRLLKFHLMQNQLQAPYADDAMERTGRKASPLLSTDYARGMRTQLWNVATDIGRQMLFDHLFGPKPGISGNKKSADNEAIKPGASDRNKQIKDFETRFYIVSAPAPFVISGTKPSMVDMPENAAPIPPDTGSYVRSLKLQLVPLAKFGRAQVDSHLGAHGQRSSPSESADFAAGAMAKLIKDGKTGDALALIEPYFRKKTAKDEKKLLSGMQYDHRMLVAPYEHDPKTRRWRDPLLTSTSRQLAQLEAAYATLRETVAASNADTRLFSANLSVFDNLVRNRVKDFFDAQTPAGVTASVTDTLQTATECVIRYTAFGTAHENVEQGGSTLAQKKPYLERYYQAMQTLHEAVRFRLSWKGADPHALESGVRHMLPPGALAPTSVHASAHGLGMIGQVHHALDYTKEVGVLKNSYYETPGIFEHRTALPHVDSPDILKQDLIVFEPHPNNAEDRDVAPHDPVALLKRLAVSGRAHTVMMDVTLNHLGEPEIEKMLEVAAPLIKSGKLNLVLIQSGTKFLQHGMDIASLGIGVVFNDSKNWIEFNNRMAAHGQPTPDDDTAYLGHMMRTNKAELAGYLDAIRTNTRELKRLLSERLDADAALEVTLSSDPQTVYVAVAPTEAFISKHPAIVEKPKEHWMHIAYGLILKRMAALSLVGRSSFGFNLTNLGECITTIRITPGIENLGLLQAYAEGIGAVAEEMSAIPVKD